MAGEVTGNLGSGVVTDTHVNAGAGIEASKLKHQSVITLNFFDNEATPSGTTNLDILLANFTGEIRDVRFNLTDTGTSTNISFDLTDDAGTSLLSSAVSFTDSDTDDTPKAPTTISTAAIAAGDVIKAKMAVTSATGALGGSVTMVFDHNYV